jgi:peptidoglycan/LPS O-acetylase OafA/YrhL
VTGGAKHAAFLRAERFPSLDGLRCLAILPVIWHHSTPRPLPGLLGRGPLGVHLFFAVSGFLITTLLVREKCRTGTLSLPRFYARRSLRIFPLYYAVLALYVLRAMWLPASPIRAHFFRNLPYFLTYTANVLVDFNVPHAVIFGFSWSLATEEQFYLLWPPVLRLVRKRLTAAFVAMGFFALDLAAERGFLTGVIGRGLLFRIVTSISAPICLGSLLALALDDPRMYARIEPLLGRFWSAPLCFVALFGLVVWDAAPLLLVHLAMVALVGAVCVRPDHGVRALLEARPLVHVGKVSYGMYLFHVAVITAVKSLLPAGLGSASAIFAAAVPLTVGAATLSYSFFERPFRELSVQFRARASRPAVAQ